MIKLIDLIKESEEVLQWKIIGEFMGIDKGIYELENTKFRNYQLGSNRNNGMLTVELNKNGYRIRNVFVNPSLQGKGFAFRLYTDLNVESVKKTGIPLSSSEIGYDKKTGVTSLSIEGQQFWDKLVSAGYAVKKDHNYIFKSTKPTVKENVSQQK